MNTSAKATERPALKSSSLNLTRSLAGRWLTGLSALVLVLLTSLAQAANPTPPEGTAATAPHGAQRLERPDQVPDGVSAPDWARIRAQLETARYAIRPVVAHLDSGRYEAWNQEEQLHAQFAKGGVSLAGNAQAGQPAASARLAFMGYRYGQSLEPVSEPTLVALGNRIEYRRGSITEWYVNGPRGVEQGFCLAQRPAGSREAGPLRLELRIEGTLSGELSADGHSVLLRDRSGVEWMRYSGLKAWDARLQELVAKLETTGGAIALVVEEGNAVYPVTIDPLITMTQTKKLAPVAAANDEFGSSVSISGDTVVVGAFNFRDGAAYVFDRNNGGANNWGQAKELSAGDAAAGDYFGNSVSISGDTVVVGAYGKNSFTGAAYVFDRNNGGANNWGQVKKLTATDAAANDEFGNSVSISGDTVVVGASIKDSSTGAAYVFDRNNGGANNWGQVQKLSPSDATTGDEFGSSVSISGDSVLVGAVTKNSRDGAAYVFDRNNGGANNWGQAQKLTASDATVGDYFGSSVSIGGDTVAVGAYGKNSGTGAAYVFDRNNGGANNWGQAQKLIASDAAASDFFGSSVAISGDTVVAGARVKNSATGAAYVFDRNNGGANNWGQVKKLTATDAAANDEFGYSVAISGDTVAVGAPGENSDTGEAYVFDRNNGGGNNWGQAQKLSANDAATGDEFGYSAAISGDTVVVGAPIKDSSTGAAYVFDRNNGGGNNWGQAQKLTASDAAVGDAFGFSVSISEDTVVVGAYSKNSATGAAYVFDRNNGGPNNWGQVQKLTASDATVGDYFGSSVSISEDTVVAGASVKNSETGAAYVFDRNNGGPNNWGQAQKLTASDAVVGDFFGNSVSISGDAAVVAAPGKDSSTGAAYVFDRNNGGGNNWGQVQKLAASNAAASDGFGFSVSISGNTVVVGAPSLKDSSTGAAYVFDRDNGGANNWGQAKELAASDAAAGDQFGHSVSISGGTVAVGANAKNSATGAAYVFDRNNGGANNWGQVNILAASDAAVSDVFGSSVAVSGDTVAVGANAKNSATGAAYLFDIPATTTMVDYSSPNPSSFGQTVTIRATVSSTTPGIPTGNVYFKEGTRILGGGPQPLTIFHNDGLSFYRASVGVNDFSVGRHYITAEYEGDSSFVGSTSPVFIHTVDLAPTTLALGFTPYLSIWWGQSVTFTATLNWNAPGPPTGAVDFFDGTTTQFDVLDLEEVDANGQATFTTDALGLGTHSITALYEGDGNFERSISGAVTPFVLPAPTTTRLASTPNPSTQFEDVTFTASVSSPSPRIPVGQVTFMEGGTVLGQADVDTSGHATLTYPYFIIGTHQIKAVYSADPRFTSSSSDILPQVVAFATSTTTLSSSDNPSCPGESITFTATVSSPNPRATLTGSVNFYDNGTLLFDTVLGAGGQATYGPVLLSAGSHSVRAEFVSGNGVASSTSIAVTEVVPPPVPAIILPAGQVHYIGDQALFSVTASGPGPFGYHWRKNGIHIQPPATASTYFIGSLTAADAGVYDVEVSGICAGPTLSASLPLFVITRGLPVDLDELQSAVTAPAGTATVSTAPTTSGEGGLSATVSAGSSPTPVAVMAGTYVGNPGVPEFNAGGSYLELKVIGADASSSALVYFYYPNTVTGLMEQNLTLKYFDGSSLKDVISSGGNAPQKDMTDNRDNTMSGGRFTVIFDNTSTPKITELTGTVFYSGLSPTETKVAASPNPSSFGQPWRSRPRSVRQAEYLMEALLSWTPRTRWAQPWSE